MLCIVGVLLVLVFAPDPDTLTRRKLESRARDWQPTAVDGIRPQRSIIVDDANVVGEWTVSRRLDGSSLSISPSAPNAYSVAFSTAGCCGACRMQRAARFENGVLTLDEPVAEYYPAVYDTLYAIRANGEDLLLPAPFVQQFEEGLADDRDRSSRNFVMRQYVYRRPEAVEDDSE